MEDKIKIIKEEVEALLSKLGVFGDVSVEEKDNSFLVKITNTKSGLLIGYKGETLKALQQITRLIVYSKFPENTPAVVVDVEDYRQQEEAKLRSYVHKLAELVKSTNQAEALKPMSSYKRRLIHTFVSEIPGVSSESQGEGLDRRIVIKPE